MGKITMMTTTTIIQKASWLLVLCDYSFGLERFPGIKMFYLYTLNKPSLGISPGSAWETKCSARNSNQARFHAR